MLENLFRPNGDTEQVMGTGIDVHGVDGCEAEYKQEERPSKLLHALKIQKSWRVRTSSIHYYSEGAVTAAPHPNPSHW